MPDTDFYVSAEDEQTLVGHLLGKGGALLVDRHYSAPVPDTLDSIHAFEHLRRSEGVSQLFVIFAQCEESPVTMRRIDKGDAHFFYILPREGGPTLDLIFGPRKTVEGRVAIPHASVSHYPTYWSTTRQKNLPAPKELVSIYKAVVAEMKKEAVQLYWGPRRYWVARGAAASVRAGAALQNLPPGLVLPATGETIRIPAT
jgi:hypothetical protein